MVDDAPVVSQGWLSGKVVATPANGGFALSFESLAIVPRIERVQPPRFPREMFEARRSGHVELRVTLSGDGRIALLETVSASSDAFERAARYSLAKARVDPSSIGMRGMAFSMPFVFRLNGQQVAHRFVCERDATRPSVAGQDGCLPVIEITANPV